MATQPSKFRHKHRVTFTYPTKDPLELRFGTNGPLVYYPFSQGELLVDQSGNSRDLVEVGGDVDETASGKVGYGASFPGTTGHYLKRAAADTVLDFGEGDFTIAFWVYFDTYGEQILAEKFTGSSGPGWTLYKQNASSQMQFYTQFWVINSGGGFTQGEWQHAVVQRQGGNGRFYRNGVLLNTDGIPSGITPSTEPLRIGHRNEGDGRGFALDGRMDEFAIWNRALSADEITALYNGGVGQSVPVDGEDQVVRYVDKEVPDVDGTDTFSATPSMEIDFGARTGTFNESLTSILLPKDSFTAAISKGEPFAPIEVLIERLEFAANGTINSTHPVFRGYVLGTTRNPNGRPNRVLVKCINLKNRLRVPMGIPATAECALTFMGPGCRVDPFDLGLVKQGTITAISGKQVTFSASYVGSPPWSGAENERIYQRGFIIRNGVRIAVREFDAAVAQDTLHLVRRCPSSWLNQTVLLIPGCDKSYETCLSRWDNAARFGGYGRVIPLYNPTVETR